MISAATLARTLIVALFAGVLAFAPAQAQQVITTITTTWTYSDSADGEGFDESEVIDEAEALLGDDALAASADLGATRRYAPATHLRTPGRAQATFGPFSVINGTTVRMVGDVDGKTPRQFAAMMAAHPTLKRIEMVDCPGSLDEAANLILARAIRRAGLETVVPAGGSVRSGAVELWMAGVKRSAAPDAEFGVHSWADEYGREARDYAANDPVHAEYLSYYREMGIDDAKARAFYTMTNATPFDDVRYLTRDDMARYVTLN